MEEHKKEHPEQHSAPHHGPAHAGHKPHHINPMHKKKISWKKVFIVLGVIAVIIAAFFLIKALTGKAQTVSGLKIDYTLKLEDGTVIYGNSSTFKPGEISSFFGFASDKLDKAIEGLKAGKSVTVTLNPEDAFGEYNESYISVVNRTQEIKREFELNRTMIVPAADFKSALQEDPVIGNKYEIGEPWNGTVTEIEEGNVTISRDAEEGQFIPINEIIYANVTKVTGESVTLLYGAEEQEKESPSGNLTVTVDADYIYIKSTPPKGKQIVMGFFPATVLDYNETSITLDYNVQYAGKKIIAELKLVEIVKTAAAKKTAASSVKKIEGAPTLEAFIVSNCPYGLQMQRILAPVAEAIGSKANIIVRYIGDVQDGKVVSMHGEKEAQENLKQICIREEQPSKYWGYVSCFIKAGDSEGCSEEAEIDEDKLNDCMSGAGLDYAAKDFELNKQYSVSGSPTLILNGEKASEFDYGGRTANAVKDLICAAFEDKPSECDEQLSAKDAAASFSETYESGASTQSSSC